MELENKNVAPMAEFDWDAYANGEIMSKEESNEVRFF